MQFIYWLAELIVRVVASTWRIKINGKVPDSPVVIAFWHGSMLPVWKFFSKFDSYAILSLSKDGDILAKLLSKWNYKLVRGSSSNKGKEVIAEVLAIDKKSFFLITPDGPRGPNKQAKSGAFVIAQKKQIPLFFLDVSIKNKKVFSKSWDKFELPLLFSRIEITISEPILVSDDATRDEISALMKMYSR